MNWLQEVSISRVKRNVFHWFLIRQTGQVTNKKVLDERFMKEALQEARRAWENGEVPIGAVLVKNGVVIARGYNRRETSGDPTAHAEIIALQKAGKELGHWRLTGTTLYVTLEPCPMCAGALVQARVDRLVFGAYDAKAGAVQSLYQITGDERLNHHLVVTAEVREEECSQLLKEFFKKRR